MALRGDVCHTRTPSFGLIFIMMASMCKAAADELLHAVPAKKNHAYNMNHELRPSSDLGDDFNFTWSWKLPCIEGQQEVTQLWGLTSDSTLDPKLWENRGDRKCFSGADCFRAVHDGVIAPSQARILRDALDANRHHHPLLAAEVKAVVQLVIDTFAARHGINGLRAVDVNYIADHMRKNKAGRNKLHSDFKYRRGQAMHVKGQEGYVFSALLYLVKLDQEMGGSTSFVDRSEGAALYVYPSLGRLALFSGGAENLHGAMPVLQDLEGNRAVLAMWFDCDRWQSRAEC